MCPFNIHLHRTFIVYQKRKIRQGNCTLCAFMNVNHPFSIIYIYINILSSTDVWRVITWRWFISLPPKNIPCQWYHRTSTDGLHSNNPDSKAHEAYMGPIWDRQDPGGPHVGPMNLVNREPFSLYVSHHFILRITAAALGETYMGHYK